MLATKETTKILNEIAAGGIDHGLVICSAVARNITILEKAMPNLDRATRDSVAVCVADAKSCIGKYLESNGEVWLDNFKTLPNSYVVSAYLWVQRAAQHAYGFNIPSDWATVAQIVSITA